MMRIKVHFFASLSEYLDRHFEEVTLPAGQTVAQLWQRIDGHEHYPQQVWCAVNQQMRSFNTPLCDGDEVGFFPPVTGG